MYACEVLADSRTCHPTDPQRLVTVKVTFPRFILAEVNTHRVFSRNSASSRAIPTGKLIERVKEEPFIPMTFNHRVKGMGVGARLKDDEQTKARMWWLTASENAVRCAEELMKLDVDKSRANRLLEPFMWHTAIISSTEWDNFFALRDHEAAQPEFRHLAGIMLDTMRESTPRALDKDQWHLPLITEDEWYSCEEEECNWAYMGMVSAGRCARVSFGRAADYEHPAESHGRAKKLLEAGHMSPFEHPAKPGPGQANFKGFMQLREGLLNQENFGAQYNRPHWED